MRAAMVRAIVTTTLTIVFGAGLSAQPPRSEPLPKHAVLRLGTLRFRHPGRIQHLAWSPDGQLLTSASEYTICSWAAKTGKQLFQLSWRVETLAYSPDSKFLVICRKFSSGLGFGRDHHISLLHAASGRHQAALNQGVKHVNGIAFSPDGKHLAIQSETLKFGVRPQVTRIAIWDVKSPRQLSTIEIRDTNVTLLGYSPDGRSLIFARLYDPFAVAFDPGKTANKPGKLYVYDLAAKAVRDITLTPKTFWLTAKVSPQKTLLGSVFNNRAELWNWHTGKRIRVLKQRTDVRGLAFSPDGKTVALGVWDKDAKTGMGYVVLLETATGKERRRLPGFADQLAFSPDGTTLATAGLDCTIRIWDTHTGKRKFPDNAATDAVTCAGFSSYGKAIVTAANGGLVQVWDGQTGALQYQRQLQRGFGEYASFGYVGGTSNGDILASISTTPFFKKNQRYPVLWDVKTGRPRLRVPGAKPVKGTGGLPVCPVAFSHNGRWAACLTNPTTISLWDVTANKVRFRWDDHEGRIYACQFHGDKVLTVCPNEVKKTGLYTVHVRNATTGQRITRLQLPANDAMPMTLSPDGTILAVTTHSHNIRFVDVHAQKQISATKSRHWFTKSLRFSPDGQLLACGDAAGKIHILDVATAKELFVLNGHRGQVLALAFDSWGRRLVSTSDDTTALVWDLAKAAIAPHDPTKKLTPVLLRHYWSRLLSDDGKARVQAFWHLVVAEEAAVGFLKKQLHPVPTAKPQEIRGLIAKLDHRRFAVREAAAHKLQRMGIGITPHLHKTLQGTPTLELKLRIEQLLPQLPLTLRSIDVLEHIGSGEAHRLLADMAKGAPRAAETSAARAALERLQKVSRTKP